MAQGRIRPWGMLGSLLSLHTSVTGCAPAGCAGVFASLLLGALHPHGQLAVDSRAWHGYLTHMKISSLSPEAYAVPFEKSMHGRDCLVLDPHRKPHSGGLSDLVAR